MKARTTAPIFALVIALGSLIFATAEPTRADSVGVVQHVVLGPSPNGAQQRLNAQRTGQSTLELPEGPRLLWRGNVPGGTSFAPVVDGQGRLVFVSQAGQLVQLDSRGRVSWQAPLGAGAAGAPVVRNDGVLLVATKTGQLLAISPTGRKLFTTELHLPEDARTKLTALPDGSLAIASEQALLRVDRQGVEFARATLPHAVAEVMLASGQLVLVTRSGQVYTYDDKSRPKLAAELPGLVGSPAAVEGDAIVWSDGHHVTVTTLHSRRSRDWAQLDDQELVGPITLISKNSVAIGAKPDALVLVQADGGVRRINLSNDASASGPASAALSDPQGRLAIVNHAGELLLLDSAGSLQNGAGARCLELAGIVPLAHGSLALACVSGRVMTVGDARHFTNPR